MSPHALLDRLKQRSHFVHGHRVVQDKDVAELYGVSVKKLRGAVKRYLIRFPPDFLIEENNQFFFTEEGILMVSSVIRNSRATEVSLAIVRELFGFNKN